MAEKQIDSIRCLEWLEWVDRQHSLNRPQSEIDTRAFYRIAWFRPNLTKETLQLYEDAIADAFDCPRPGQPEACMSNACRCVIRLFTEADWVRYIKDDMPDKAAAWRPFWDAARSSETSAPLEQKLKTETFDKTIIYR